MKNKNEIRVFNYKYSIILNSDNSLNFKTIRFGLLAEDEILSLVSNASDNKEKNELLFDRYVHQMELIRKWAISGVRDDTGSMNFGYCSLLYVIEEYSSYYEWTKLFIPNNETSHAEVEDWKKIAKAKKAVKIMVFQRSKDKAIFPYFLPSTESPKKAIQERIGFATEDDYIGEIPF